MFINTLTTRVEMVNVVASRGLQSCSGEKGIMDRRWGNLGKPAAPENSTQCTGMAGLGQQRVRLALQSCGAREQFGISKPNLKAGGCRG